MTRTNKVRTGQVRLWMTFALGLVLCLSYGGMTFDVIASSTTQKAAGVSVVSSQTKQQKLSTYRLKGSLFHTLNIANIRGNIDVQTHPQADWKLEVTECLKGKGVPYIPLVLRTGGGEASFSLSREVRHVTSPVCGFYAKYRVYMPKGKAISLRSVSGDIVVAGGKTTTFVRTVSGNIRLSSVHDPNVQTVSGDVVVKQSSGKISLRTVSGKVDLDGGRGASLFCKSVSGDVKMKKVDVSTLRIRTMSGDLTIDGLRVKKDSRLSTFSGQLTLTFVQPKSMKLVTKTMSGVISSKYPIGKVWQRVSGQPHAVIRLRTFSGDIKVN